MGLDMYAHRRVYVKQWEHQKPEERYTVDIARGGKPVAGIKPERISSVEEEVMYWRKANHIHAWFVDSVQKGIDNCAEYFVGEGALRELLSACKEVIAGSKIVDGDMHTASETSRKHGLVEHREPRRVIEDPTVAMETLPTRAGFFFGNTEYDGEYLDDVVRTQEWAERMLEDRRNGVPGDIYYSSSW